MSSSVSFQNSQFDPDLPRNNIPAVVTKLYRGFGSDKSIDWELRRRLEPIYVLLLRDPLPHETNIGFLVE